MGRIITQLWITGKESYSRDTSTDTGDSSLLSPGGILIDKMVWVSQWNKQIVVLNTGRLGDNWGVEELAELEYNGSGVITYPGFFIDGKLAIQWRDEDSTISGVIFPGTNEWYKFNEISSLLEIVGGTKICGGWWNGAETYFEGVVLRITGLTAYVTTIYSGDGNVLCLSPVSVKGRHYLALSVDRHYNGVIMLDDDLTPLKIVVTPTTSSLPRGFLKYANGYLYHIGVFDGEYITIAQFDLDLNLIRARKYNVPAVGWGGIDAEHNVIAVSYGGDIYVWGFDDELNLTPGTKIHVFDTTDAVMYALEPSPGIMIALFSDTQSFVSKLPPTAEFSVDTLPYSTIDPPEELATPTFEEIPLLEYDKTVWTLSPVEGEETPVTPSYSKVNYGW